jgi:hypothetical protein
LIESVLLADASIMPRIITGNTMAPCVVIGERASDLLRRQHGPSSGSVETDSRSNEAARRKSVKPIGDKQLSVMTAAAPFRIEGMANTSKRELVITY